MANELGKEVLAPGARRGIGLLRASILPLLFVSRTLSLSALEAPMDGVLGPRRILFFSLFPIASAVAADFLATRKLWPRAWARRSTAR